MFPATTYIDRRARLVRRLGRGVVLLPGHGHSPINYRDNAYPFRQDSTLLYFCGISQPDAALLIDCDSGQATWLADEPQPDDIVWTGPVPERAEVAASAGIEHHARLADLPALLAGFERQGRRVHRLPSARGDAAGPAISDELLQAVIALRAVKSDEEVAEIEAVLHHTRDMHLLAIRLARSGTAPASRAATARAIVPGPTPSSGTARSATS